MCWGVVLFWAPESRFYQGLLSSTRSLSRSWNFPDTIIKKALMMLFDQEDYVYCCTSSSLAPIAIFRLSIVMIETKHLGAPRTTTQDHHDLKEQVREMDRDGWATTCTLRCSALFRHYSQSALRCRKWVPQARWLKY